MLRDYYRLTKPGIIYGNLLSLVGGFLLASATWHVNLHLFFSVIIGTSLVIASACVANNYIDRDIDAKMPRTKQRALVTGTLSGRQALPFAAVLGISGFAVLIWGTNWVTVAVGAIAWVDYVWWYGWAKRHSYHGTLVGTIAGSAPVVAGYTAVTGRFDLGALLLFIVMFTWQMAHFYAIALFRAKDYAKADIPVISIVKGPAITKRWIMIYIASFAIACVLLKAGGYVGYCFLAVMVAMSVYWLWRGLQPTKSDDRWGRRMFGASLLVLLTLSLMLSVGSQLP